MKCYLLYDGSNRNCSFAREMRKVLHLKSGITVGKNFLIGYHRTVEVQISFILLFFIIATFYPVVLSDSL